MHKKNLKPSIINNFYFLKKLINLITKYNQILYLYLTSLIFFILPFFWSQDIIFVGGDSSFLDNVNPGLYLENFALSGFGHLFNVLGANYFAVPLTVIKKILYELTGSLTINYSFFSSLNLFLSFFFTFKLLELISKKLLVRVSYFSIFIGSLSYSLSPLVYLTNTYFNSLSALYMVSLYPIYIFIFLKILLDKSFVYFFHLAFFSIIFSASFNVGTVQWILPLLIVKIVICLILAKNDNIQINTLFIKNIILYFFILFVIHSSHVVPYFVLYFSYLYYGIDLNFTNFRHLGIDGSIEGVKFFNSVVNHLSSFYIFSNIGHLALAKSFDHETYPFLLKNLLLIFLNLIFFFIIIFFFFLKKSNFILYKKKNFLILIMFFFFNLLLIVGNYPIIKDIYKIFFHIPGTSILRGFYNKLSFSFAILFSIVISIALSEFLFNLKKNKNFFKILIFLIIIFSNFKFLSGDILKNYSIWGTDNINAFTNPQKINEYINLFEKNKNDLKILTFPPFKSTYEVIDFQDFKYVGPTILNFVSKTHNTTGLINENSTLIYEIFARKDLIQNEEVLKNLLKQENIFFIKILKNWENKWKSNYIVHDLAGEFASRFTEDSISKVIKKFGYKKVYETNGFVVYALDYKEIQNYKNIFSDSDNSNILYKKINNSNYVVEIKNSLITNSIILKKSYNPLWKLYPINNPEKFYKYTINIGITDKWILNNQSDKKLEKVFLNFDEQKYFGPLISLIGKEKIKPIKISNKDNVNIDAEQIELHTSYNYYDLANNKSRYYILQFDSIFIYIYSICLSFIILSFLIFIYVRINQKK
jgi:hypothetical protein